MGRKKKDVIEAVPTSKNGQILENRLWQVIYGKAESTGTRAVRSPSALYTALHLDTSIASNGQFDLATYKERICNTNRELWYILLFMHITGCRVSEALNISNSDITVEGRVLLRGLKGSLDRMIIGSELSEYFIYCRKNLTSPFKTFDRHFIYRFMKKMGIGAYFGQNERQSVTHIFRHLAILDMAGVDKDLHATKRTIGHKSISNTEHYAKGKKR